MVMRETDRVVVLEPTQDLYEGDECDRMEETLARLAGRGARVIVDVSRVQHVSARCLGILAQAHRDALAGGGHVVLCGLDHVQRWLLAKTGLAGVLVVLDDVAAALQYMAARARAVA
jgi:anti-anti-sigma factor